MSDRIFLDSFSGSIADIPKSRRTAENALAVLVKDQLVSTWDRSEKAWVNTLLADLMRRGWVVEQREPYPWHRYTLTEAGETALIAVEVGP